MTSDDTYTYDPDAWSPAVAGIVAGAIGGIAGAFWISNLAAISPEHFPWGWSLWLVAATLLGPLALLGLAAARAPGRAMLFAVGTALPLCRMSGCCSFQSPRRPQRL